MWNSMAVVTLQGKSDIEFRPGVSPGLSSDRLCLRCADTTEAPIDLGRRLVRCSPLSGWRAKACEISQLYGEILTGSV